MHPFESLAVPERGVGVHWFGQNSFALKDSSGRIVFIDPYFPRHRPVDEFIHSIAPLDESQLKPDLILLTHDHGDHTFPESLERIRAAFPEARFYGPVESISRLKSRNFSDHLLHEVAPGMDISDNGIGFAVVWSKPPGGVPEDNIPAPDVTHLGYILDLAPVRIYVTGDLIRTFGAHPELLDPVRKLKPDLGLLTTHPTEEEFPDFEGSVDIAVKLGLRAAIPAHYGCFRKRTFDPTLWVAAFPPSGPRPILIEYNTSIIYDASS